MEFEKKNKYGLSFNDWCIYHIFQVIDICALISPICFYGHNFILFSIFILLYLVMKTFIEANILAEAFGSLEDGISEICNESKEKKNKAMGEFIRIANYQRIAYSSVFLLFMYGSFKLHLFI